MKIYIKYMVGIRCKMLVKAALKKQGIRYLSIELGEVKIPGNITHDQYTQMSAELLQSGLEVMTDKKALLVAKIKNSIIAKIYSGSEIAKIRFSSFLSEKLEYDYTYLANLFSSSEGTTIEQFIIHHKIERVKELLNSHQFSLTKIASNLHYSSVCHLSNQFKKLTGMTPSLFKSLEHKKNKSRVHT